MSCSYLALPSVSYFINILRTFFFDFVVPPLFGPNTLFIYKNLPLLLKALQNRSWAEYLAHDPNRAVAFKAQSYDPHIITWELLEMQILKPNAPRNSRDGAQTSVFWQALRVTEIGSSVRTTRVENMGIRNKKGETQFRERSSLDPWTAFSLNLYIILPSKK